MTKYTTRTIQKFRKAHELKLSLSQVLTLLILEQDIMTTSAISREIGLSSAAMTGIIDKLEERHLVVRQRNRLDRRVITIELAPKGHDVVHCLSEYR